MRTIALRMRTALTHKRAELTPCMHVSRGARLCSTCMDMMRFCTAQWMHVRLHLMTDGLQSCSQSRPVMLAPSGPDSS